MSTTFTLLKGASGYKSKAGKAVIYARVQFPDKGINIRVSTGLLTEGDIFSLGKKSTKFQNYYQTPKGRGYNEFLKWGEIAMRIDQHVEAAGAISVDEVRGIIDSIVNRETREQGRLIAEQKKLEADRREAERREAERVTLREYCRIYVAEMENGERYTPGQIRKKYAYNTVKSVRNRIKNFTDFLDTKTNGFDFNDVTPDTFEELQKWMTVKNYSTNTIGSTVKDVKALLHTAQRAGLTDNKSYEGIYASNHEVADAIFLTREEIDRIAAVNPHKHPETFREPERAERLRDIFLVGFCCGQRISDYKDIKPENIRRAMIDGKVTTYLKLTQKKTGKTVTIPANPMLCGLIEKYNGNLPNVTWEQDLNDYIKRFARVAGINDTVTTKIVKGGKTVTSKHEKWELVTSHTARRSFASDAYLAGMDKFDIAFITGHGSIKQLETYIKANELDALARIARNNFFQ